MTTASHITLRALEGAPLHDQRIREMVMATAHALAERHGMTLLNIAADDESVTVTLPAGRIEAMGFAAELRRLTTRWYTQKFGVSTLWGELDRDADQDESWNPH